MKTFISCSPILIIVAIKQTGIKYTLMNCPSWKHYLCQTKWSAAFESFYRFAFH